MKKFLFVLAIVVSFTVLGMSVCAEPLTLDVVEVETDKNDSQIAFCRYFDEIQKVSGNLFEGDFETSALKTHYEAIVDAACISGDSVIEEADTAEQRKEPVWAAVHMPKGRERRWKGSKPQN